MSWASFDPFKRESNINILILTGIFLVPPNIISVTRHVTLTWKSIKIINCKIFIANICHCRGNRNNLRYVLHSLPPWSKFWDRQIFSDVITRVEQAAHDAYFLEDKEVFFYTWFPIRGRWDCTLWQISLRRLFSYNYERCFYKL